jgi:environmental stress-induced protein Ves
MDPAQLEDRTVAPSTYSAPHPFTHILRAAQHRRMRWKNGMGETVEIAVSPDAASLVDFDWRVSMAHVGSDGLFSLFAGIDRTLCVLEGDGIVLAIADRPEVELTLASAPLVFPGDVAIASRLLGGPIIDLNVMTRRGSFRHAVRRLAIEGSTRMSCDASVTLLLSRSNGLSIKGALGHARLNEDDALIIESHTELELSSASHAFAFAIEIGRTV